MSSLYIDFGYDDNVKRSVKSAKRAIDSRISDYKGVKNSLNSVSTNTSNLWNANSYIQKKNNQLQAKSDKLGAFHTKITNFNDCAYNADQRVADRINKETHDFYKREGIPHGFLYTIGSTICEGAKWLKGKITSAINAVVEGLKSVWAVVKKFYKDNKYWIDPLVDVIKIVATAVAVIASTATGITFVLTVIFAVWSILKSGTDFIYDTAGAVAHYSGDEKRYDELAGTTLEKLMEENVPGGKKIYHGMEIASVAFDIGKMGTDISNILSDPKNVTKGKDILFNVIGVKSYKGKTGISLLNSHLNNLKFVISIPHNFLNYDPKTAALKSFKLGDMYYKMDKAGKELGIDWKSLAMKTLMFPIIPAPIGIGMGAR